VKNGEKVEEKKVEMMKIGRMKSRKSNLGSKQANVRLLQRSHADRFQGWEVREN
jgi:hypothetical protein